MKWRFSELSDDSKIITPYGTFKPKKFPYEKLLFPEEENCVDHILKLYF